MLPLLNNRFRSLSERRLSSVKILLGTGGIFESAKTGFFPRMSVGIVLENLECEDIYWEKAYLCFGDACNVDNGMIYFLYLFLFLLNQDTANVSNIGIIVVVFVFVIFSCGHATL